MNDQDKDREIEELRARLAKLENSQAQSAKELEAEAPEPVAATSPLPENDPAADKIVRHLGLFGAAIVILVGIGLCSKMTTQPENDDFDSQIQRDIAAEVQARAEEKSRLAEAPWNYRSSLDPMTDKPTQFACTTSTNEVLLDWPYSNVSADLCIRQSPQHGLDAYLKLNGDGQILCRSYNDCTVSIRFGDREPQRFSATEASDNSSNIIFITNASRFIQNVKGAETTKVQIELYQAGSQAVEFNTKGLEWPRPAE